MLVNILIPPPSCSLPIPQPSGMIPIPESDTKIMENHIPKQQKPNLIQHSSVSYQKMVRGSSGICILLLTDSTARSFRLSSAANRKLPRFPLPLKSSAESQQSAVLVSTWGAPTRDFTSWLLHVTFDHFNPPHRPPPPPPPNDPAPA